MGREEGRLNGREKETLSGLDCSEERAREREMKLYGHQSSDKSAILSANAASKPNYAFTNFFLSFTKQTKRLLSQTCNGQPRIFPIGAAVAE